MSNFLSEALKSDSRKFAVIVGPCSIHSERGALEYANLLAEMQKNMPDEIALVMRCYLEKPRSGRGWRGFISDPDHEGSCNPVEGLRRGRELLKKIKALGVLTAYEYVDPLIAGFVEEYVDIGVIGARTISSQGHRQLVASSNHPFLLKNGVDGGIKVALDTIDVVKLPGRFPKISDQGKLEFVHASGNNDIGLVLRGGDGFTNYEINHVTNAYSELSRFHPTRLVIDASHGNSGKSAKSQEQVIIKIIEDLETYLPMASGIMIESYLNYGRQELDGINTDYSISVTDECISWESTAALLNSLASKYREVTNCAN